MARGLEALLQGVQAARLIADPITSAIRDREARKERKQEIDSEMQVKMALLAAQNPELGITRTPGEFNRDLEARVYDNLPTVQPGQEDATVKANQGVTPIAGGFSISPVLRKAAIEAAARQQQAALENKLAIEDKYKNYKKVIPELGVMVDERDGTYSQVLPEGTIDRRAKLEQQQQQAQFQNQVSQAEADRLFRSGESEKDRALRLSEGQANREQAKTLAELAREAKGKKEENIQPLLQEKAENAKNIIKEIKPLIGVDTAGTIGNMRRSIPWSVNDAKILQSKVNSLKSQISMSELLKMKEKGASLGALSDSELKLLGDSISSLDLETQDASTLLNSINVIEKSMDKIAKAEQESPRNANDVNQDAVKWLLDNPNDPRAPAIRKKLGI